MSVPDLATAIKAEARRLGFDICRIVSVDQPPHLDFFQRWLALDRAGEMTYLLRHLDKRRNPALLAPAGPPFRSIIVLAVDYHQFDLPPDLAEDPARGVIASYAWGDDYHELIRPALHALDGFIRARTGRTTQGKALVDTGPVLERDWAQAGGIGFSGKNCCTIRPGRGSWLFLATLLVPEDLPPDPAPRPLNVPPITPAQVAAGLPRDGDYGMWELPRAAGCGRCTRCLDACPTQAFVGPYHLDPLRCISYWTIESRQPIPRPLRSHFGNRIFGCDICQEVCPWNRRLADRAPRLSGLQARQNRIAPPLLEGFQAETPYWLVEEAFNERWRRSPVKRAKRAGMLRNVCVALGNWGDVVALPALVQGLHDPDRLARGHAAWALGQLLRGGGEASISAALRGRLDVETDAWVREEIGAALGLEPQ